MVETSEYHSLLSVYQHRTAGLFDIPPSLEAISSETQTLYLQSGGDADRPFGGGELATQAPAAASISSTNARFIH